MQIDKTRRCLIRNGTGLAAALLVSALPAGAHAQSRAVAAGKTLVIDQPTTLATLDIAPGATVRAAEGKSLTMTIDGVGTAIAPGRYAGRIVLTPTADIVVPSMLGDAQYRLRSAIYVSDGAYRPDRSVTAAAQGGIGATTARDVRIASDDPGFNGIIVTGKGPYRIDGANIRLGNDGGDDSIGYGAAIVANGDAVLTVNHARIRTAGVIRTAVFVDGRAQVMVNDADIETLGGTLPPDYQFSILPGRMKEVPYGLGISGTTRATNVEGTASVTYTRTHIRAHGWGALATDGDGPTHLTAKDSVIEVLDSGYGAYANGHAQDLFDHCTFDVPDYGLVVGGPGSATFTNRTVVRSKRFGVMMHQGTGGGAVVIDRGSMFETGSTAIAVKGRGTTITVDGATLRPGNGILLQTMDNDDPIMKDMASGRNGPGAAPPPPPPPGATPPPTYSGDVVATLRNGNFTGDVVHAMRGKGMLALTLRDATLTGAISTATATPPSGREPTRETFRTIGDVTNRLEPVAEVKGLKVVLAPGASWVVTKTSYLTALSLASTATLRASAGNRLTLLVDGREVPIGAGDRVGQITLRVDRSG